MAVLLSHDLSQFPLDQTNGGDKYRLFNIYRVLRWWLIVTRCGDRASYDIPTTLSCCQHSMFIPPAPLNSLATSALLQGPHCPTMQLFQLTFVFHRLPQEPGYELKAREC